MTHITLCNLHVFIVRSISNRSFRLSSHVLAMLSISGRDFHSVYLAPMISRARIVDRARVSQHDRKAQGNDVNRFQFHMETHTWIQFFDIWYWLLKKFIVIHDFKMLILNISRLTYYWNVIHYWNSVLKKIIKKLWSFIFVTLYYFIFIIIFFLMNFIKILLKRIVLFIINFIFLFIWYDIRYIFLKFFNNFLILQFIKDVNRQNFYLKILFRMIYDLIKNSFSLLD